MESAPEHDMMDPKSPPESLPIEEIVQALEKAATHDGLRQIIYYIESDLSDTLANPHQTEETKERTMNLSDLLIEARRRSLQFSQKEIERLQKNLNQDANQWGLTHEMETPFTVVKSKTRSRKPTDTQAAKKARTDDDSYKNRFSHLTIQETNEQAEMDTATATPMPSPHPSPRRAQRSANTTHSIPRRQMAPPIIIDNIKNGTTPLKSMQAVTKTKLTAKLTGTSLRIYPQTAHAYHKIRHYIDEQKLQAHTYMLPEEKKIKAVIRGMPIDMPPTEIAEELLEKNITAEEVHIMTNKMTGLPMPLFLVTLNKNPDNQKIFSITQLGYMEVNIEGLRKKYGPAQCFRCQGFYHSSKYCTREPKNPINHPPKPKDAPPPVNRWRLRAAARAPRVEPQQAQELSTEDFPPPLPTQPKPKKTPQEATIATDPFTILKHPKCRELYKEMMEFVNIAQNIPTKAGRMAALFKFIDED
ncbi:nucleic-acid-binding protein from transposon X-element [Nephila pilipes]|uniref:Nucleic-acid-binding protein from transposon X-element n=1 Tax=Nephila pilipes TaxID=299642 RepID=A0A8X6QB26_NEPPI|nr:nucleic-acid-binding protein from transposon X-element [Nephila pilipes]